MPRNIWRQQLLQGKAVYYTGGRNPPLLLLSQRIARKEWKIQALVQDIRVES